MSHAGLEPGFHTDVPNSVDVALGTVFFRFFLELGLERFLQLAFWFARTPLTRALPPLLARSGFEIGVGVGCGGVASVFSWGCLRISA